MNRIITLLIVVFVFSLNAIANNNTIPQYPTDIFALKGKRIVLLNNYVTWSNRLGSNTPSEKVFYNHNALQKSKFSSKNLYKGNVTGKELIVDDVELRNDKYLLIKFTDGNDSLAMYVSQRKHPFKDKFGERTISEETKASRKIGFYYYDGDEFAFIKSHQGEPFYYEGNKKCTAEINLNNNNSFYELSLKDEKGHVVMHSTISPYQIYVDIKNGNSWGILQNDYNKFYLKNFISKIIFEKDLIAKCENNCDTNYISSIKEKFINNEVFVNKDGWNDFYTFDSIAIRNIGIEYPEYKYVICLSSKNKSRYLAIDSDNMNSIVSGKQKREEILMEEEAARKRAEEEAATEEKRAIEETRKQQEYKNHLIKKFGKKNANLILDGQVQIGFTKEMCIEAWGEPYDINRTITGYGTLEQWVYGIGTYLYFEGNVLTGIQD